jgi:hypothetical protein
MGLLRFPGGTIAKEALTGDAVLDRYLVDLDAKLHGSAQLRLRTLAEIKDTLLERKEQARASGKSALEAAERAVGEIGDAEAFAAPQRAELRKLALQRGLPFGLFMALFQYATLSLHHQIRWWPMLPIFVAIYSAAGATFGIAMAYFQAFSPAPNDPSRANGSSVYLVAERTHTSATLLTLYFFASGLVMILGGLEIVPAFTRMVFSVLQPTSQNAPFAQALCVGFGLVSVALAALLWNFLRRYRVDPSGFSIERFGRARRIDWSAVKSVAPLGKRFPWAPAAWKRISVITFVSAAGGEQRVLVSPSMSNTDRFLLELREQVARR